MRIGLWLLVPFFGTGLGALAVFFLKSSPPVSVQRGLCGFAAGVMTAASFWSLLLPALERSAAMGAWAFVPAAVGFWMGVLLLRLLDTVDQLRLPGTEVDPGTGRMLLAVVLHNLPEGMAVGAAFAAVLAEEAGFASAAAFTFGIAVQNLPEGAIVSMPLHASGAGRGRSFLLGALSGAVEPLGAVLTLALAGLLTPTLPYVLSFAAGAMLTVVMEELAPSVKEAPGLGFPLGFTLMMALDAALA